MNRLLVLLLLALGVLECWMQTDMTVRSEIDDLQAVLKNRTVLAFGDGLTKGYLGLSKNKTRSYAVQLNRYLNKSSIPLYLSAKNSESTGIAAIRLPKVLALPNQKRVKLVIIMSGTSDIVLNYNVSRILSNLTSMHKKVHNNGTFNDPILTMAVAIPRLRDHQKAADTIRQEVNNGLMKYAHECHHLVHYSNFDSELNRSVAAFWGQDGIHMSEKGYDELGRLLYQEILKFVRRVSVLKNTNIAPGILC